MKEEFLYTDDGPMATPPVKEKLPRGRPAGGTNMMGVRRNGKFTVPKKRRYIQLLKKNGGNKRAAAAAMNVGISTVEYHIKKDSAFRERVEQAKLWAENEVDEEIRRRGVEGWEEDIYYKGEKVGVVRKYSDALLMERARMLSGRYRKEQNLNITHNYSEDAKRKLAEILSRREDNIVDVEPIE